MAKIVPIVEGDGEVGATPPLLHKILEQLGEYDIFIAKPKNANGRGNLIKTGGLERFLAIASLEQDCGAIIIVLDAEEDCPVEIAQGFVQRIHNCRPKCPVVVAVANRMFENWIIASIETVRGQPLGERIGIEADVDAPDDVESVNGKAFLNKAFPAKVGRAYKETLDQESMTRLIDYEMAFGRSRSFRRLSNAVKQAVAAIRSQEVVVTPTL